MLRYVAGEGKNNGSTQNVDNDSPCLVFGPAMGLFAGFFTCQFLLNRGRS